MFLAFKSNKLLLFFLILFCLFIFFTGLGNYGLLDKDEPRYAGCALEMLQNNDFLVPKFNFQYRFDKPVLYYWLIAASYKLFGVSDFTSRIPSALCAVFCVLFTWYTSTVVLGRLRGFVCALVLLTSIEYILLGRRAATDIALCFFFSATLYSLFLGYYFKNLKIKIFWTIFSGVFAGLAVLTKGPIGIILPLIVLACFLATRKNFDLKHIKIFFIISFLAVLISFPWYFAVHCVTKGEFTRVFFFEHNLNRFTSVVGEHPGPIWFYVPVIIGGFMPWTFLFLNSIFNLSKRLSKKNFNKLILFCFIWAFVVFLFFSLSTTKLATYILLLFPPLSIITGYWISVLGLKNMRFLKTILKLTVLAFLPALVYAIYLILKWKITSLEKNMILFEVSSVLLFMILALILCFKFYKKYNSLISVFSMLLTVSLVSILNFYLVPYYKHTHEELRHFAELAKEARVKEIISFGMYRPSLAYYSRVPVNFDEKKSQIQKIKQYYLESAKQDIFLIGHSSDINKHKKLFQNVAVIEMGKKYFVARL